MKHEIKYIYTKNKNNDNNKIKNITLLIHIKMIMDM